ncbi:hypothetical protein VCHC51A1_1917, partial [Vibrio cholerae HC-51A1]
MLNLAFISRSRTNDRLFNQSGSIFINRKFCV